jgi:hypothetical protein
VHAGANALLLVDGLARAVRNFSGGASDSNHRRPRRGAAISGDWPIFVGLRSDVINLVLTDHSHEVATRVGGVTTFKAAIMSA